MFFLRFLVLFLMYIYIYQNHGESDGKVSRSAGHNSPEGIAGTAGEEFSYGRKGRTRKYRLVTNGVACMIFEKYRTCR